MSKDFEFDLDDILSEFGARPAEKSGKAAEPAPAKERPAPPPAVQAVPAASPKAEERYGQQMMDEFLPREEIGAQPQPAPAEPELVEPEPAPAAPELTEPEPAPAEPEEPEQKTEKPPKRAKKKKRNKRELPPDEEEPGDGKENPKKEGFFKRLGYAALSLIFAAISLAGLMWSLNNLHPETTSTEAVKASNSTDVVARLNSNVNNSKADALSDIAYIRKHYTIPEGDTVAPAPNPACYGEVTVDRATEVLDVIQKARDSGLLEGQDVIFDPTVEFYSDSTIQYYCDDTILTICWKQIIDNTVCSCVEVKIADASQFRRKFVDDTFGSPVKLFATALAKSVNSVVAMNADFYMFRDFGIVAYQRQLYRFADTNYTGQYQKYNCIDTLFIDTGGHFHYFHRLEKSSWEEMQQYINDNDILFSIAFGPILIENGELQECTWYPAGEWNTGYSRAGIGWFDELHYFYMNVNHSPVSAARWTINDYARHLYELGITEAYGLDGGQTGEIVFRGQPYNYIDFGSEREVSDIIYFATAIPESEVSQ